MNNMSATKDTCCKHCECRCVRPTSGDLPICVNPECTCHIDTCVCGNPAKPNVVHSKKNPCYVPCNHVMVDKSKYERECKFCHATILTCEKTKVIASEIEHTKHLAIKGTWQIIKGRLLEMADDFENAQHYEIKGTKLESDSKMWNIAMKQAKDKIHALISELDKLQ